MSRRSISTCAIPALVLWASLLSGCSPTKPVFPLELRVAISAGSNTLDIGQTAAATAVMRYSDDREIDISDIAAWSSTNTAVVSVNRGVVTAVGRGSADVQAAYGQQRGVMSFHVR